MLASALAGQYALVIDARSQREYTEDHVPSAVNLPVVDNEEYAEVGTTHRTDKHRAYLIGVSYALKNISHAIDDLVAGHPKDARMLVLLLPRGQAQRVVVRRALHHRIPSGSPSGRLEGVPGVGQRSVDRTPRKFRFHVLCGPTGCGKTRLLSALATVGAQVLDLEALARHRGSLIGDIPDMGQPTQKWFESQLVDALRRFDPEKPMWVESESKKIGAIQLPGALLEAMRDARVFAVSAPMSERVQLWREDYAHFERDPDALIERLRHLRPLIGGEEFAHWESLAKERRMPELFQRLMEAHYDPAYGHSIRKNYPLIEDAAKVDLRRLDGDSLLEAARQLHEEPATV